MKKIFSGELNHFDYDVEYELRNFIIDNFHDLKMSGPIIDIQIEFSVLKEQINNIIDEKD